MTRPKSLHPLLLCPAEGGAPSRKSLPLFGTVGSLTALNPGAVRICGLTISGSLSVTGAGGFVLIGDPGDDTCTPNTIAGSMIVQKIHHGLEAIANQVKGGIITNANTGPCPEDTAPDISGNGP